MKSVPQPIPETLIGEKWRFATIAAADLVGFADLPIPIKKLPSQSELYRLGIASDTAIPGVVIYGGKNSLKLAQWLDQQQPQALDYVPTQTDAAGGLILHTYGEKRWIIATFLDVQFAQAALNYQKQKQTNSPPLHFLLVQPDDSNVTYSGLWLFL
jgi:hypothetical protein